MKRFKVTYENGFEVIEARDLWSLVKRLKIDYRRFFRMPLQIETL